MKKLKVFTISLLLLMLALSTVASAHSGRYDDISGNQCHEDKEENNYHCKDGSVYSSQEEYLQQKGIAPVNEVKKAESSHSKNTVETDSEVEVEEKQSYLSDDPDRQNVYYKGIKTTETAYVRNSKTYNISSQLKREKVMEFTEEELAALEALDQPEDPEHDFFNPEHGFNPEEGYPEEGFEQDYQGNPSAEHDQRFEERRNRNKGSEQDGLNEAPQDGFSADYEYGSPQ